MKNDEIAAVFTGIADMLAEKKDNIFKIRAYRKVAQSIQELTLPVEQLVVENRLDEIPGAGEAITKKIKELVATGKLDYYNRLKKEIQEQTQSATGQGII